MFQIKNGLLRKTIGICLLVIGIIGLIVPIIPGWLFIIPGLIILKINIFKKYFDKIRKRRIVDGEIKKINKK